MEKVILNKLVDKYERSKTHLDQNKVNQTFKVKIKQLCPEYGDDSNYDIFEKVNDACELLKCLNYVNYSKGRNKVIDVVYLNKECIDDIYLYLNRKSKKDHSLWIKEVLSKYEKHHFLQPYVTNQYERLTKGQKVEGDDESFDDLLKLIAYVSGNEHEIFERELSVHLFKDSKRIHTLKARALTIMDKYGDYANKDSIFEECNVLKMPTYISMKGKAKIYINNQVLDLTFIPEGIALPTTTLKQIQRIELKTNSLYSVENLTSFYQMKEEGFIIYLGGFHNQSKRSFLKMIYEAYPNLNYYHFGDIDAGGFYIYEHLKRKTMIPFKTYKMDLETLKKYEHYSKPLTNSDVNRLKMLYDHNYEYKDVIGYMLAHNCKIEQEVIEL